MTIDAPVAGFAGLHHENDVDLLAAAKRRDAKAFGVLVARYHKLVYRVVWRLMNGHPESEDIAQDTFLKLWDNPSQVRDAAAVKGWLIRVAQNLVMDWLRQRPRTATELTDVGDGRPDAEQLLERDRLSNRLNAVVATLPERQRLAITLVHFEQFAQAEAAETMDLTVDAFESLLARARRALKEQLTGDRQDMLATLTEEG